MSKLDKSIEAALFAMAMTLAENHDALSEVVEVTMDKLKQIFADEGYVQVVPYALTETALGKSIDMMKQVFSQEWYERFEKELNSTIKTNKQMDADYLQIAKRAAGIEKSK